MMAIAIPGWLTMPQHRAEFAVRLKMRELEQAAGSWSEEKGSYPLTREELAAALAQAKLSGGQASKYQRGGAVVAYEVLVVSDATGPSVRAERPAVLSYAVSGDARRFWITGTALPAEVSESVVPVSEPTGKMFVVTGELAPPAPALRPATSTKK
jgi:hypothetical protein